MGLKTLKRGGTYREKIARICSFVLGNSKAAVGAKHIIHDKDLQRWALQARKGIDHEDFQFKASNHRVKNFKRAHRIVSTKIDKCTTKKTIEAADYLQKKADEFIIEVKSHIKEKK